MAAGNRAVCTLTDLVCKGLVKETLTDLSGLAKADEDVFLAKTEKFLKAAAGITDRINLTVVEKALKKVHTSVAAQEVALVAKQLCFWFSDLRQRSKGVVDGTRLAEGPTKNICEVFKKRLFLIRASYNDLLCKITLLYIPPM